LFQAQSKKLPRTDCAAYCRSILTVQALLGHKFVDTTLNYARLYDGTIAADYYRAMAFVEKQLDLQPSAELPVTPGYLLAMVDTLTIGTLNNAQREVTTQASCLTEC
jgi:hypothetical protein